ncbi:OmpA/MotB family protein [Puia dinghuensis]|uniref:Flagellar motor protein MotB n=1 Tax=Puia dinghuensis TaxID=1792502 RepID=A0A8J2UCH5_9BACT|nr:OmpA family protein [Puia dinghuensis]GGA98787.1 flagellar motor protein MotB [Puia dinghuensis]
MRIKHMALAGIIPLMLFSCVSSKKFKGLQSKYDSLNNAYGALQNDLKNCNSKTADLTRDKSDCDAKVADLQKQIAFLKENNTQALKQLEDMSVISSQQAQSIRQSLDNLGAKDAYIQSLQQAMAHKDSLNMALVNNLKGAIGDLNDKDINIKVDKGVIYVDISDKLLFATGKYNVTPRAQEVLGKVAKVLQAQPDIEFMVEGHTDNVPFRRGDLLDNWDLSVKRATAVVRILQNKYGMVPAHMSAAGRGEYLPVASNDTAEGRQLNRRTRIVILPQLDQFFKLLERK